MFLSASNVGDMNKYLTRTLNVLETQRLAAYCMSDAVLMVVVTLR